MSISVVAIGYLPKRIGLSLILVSCCVGVAYAETVMTDALDLSGPVAEDADWQNQAPVIISAEGSGSVIQETRQSNGDFMIKVKSFGGRYYCLQGNTNRPSNSLVENDAVPTNCP